MKGKKIPTGTVVNEEITQEKQQPVSSREYKNMAKSSSEESSDEEEEMVLPAKFTRFSR